MLKTSLPSNIYLGILLAVFLIMHPIAQGQINKQLPVTTKPVYKNGKFIFSRKVVLNNISTSTLNCNVAGKLLKYSSPFPTNTIKKITNTNSPIILYITTTNPTCGYEEGVILVQATNGTPPYAYTLTDQYNFSQTQATGNFPGQGAASSPFTITVTDAIGSITSTIVTLTDKNQGPVLHILPGFIYPSTCKSADASFSVNATGGTPPYTYSLDLINFYSLATFTNLHNGYYTVYVKDANGCLYSIVMLFPWNNPNCTSPFGLSYTPYVCGNNGTINAKHYGNEGPYTYSLDGITYSSSGDFTNLGVGIYNVHTKNAAGILVDINGVNLMQNCFIDIDYIAVDAACKQNDGVMTVNAINGTSPYTYTIDGFNYQNSNVFTGLAPGNYSITVKDANGITSSLSATVYDRCPIVRTVSTGESCLKKDGTLTAAGFKGTQPYEYSIDGVNFQSANTFSNLAAGTYTITIKDALGFTSTVTAVVNYDCYKVTAAITNTTCGNNNGTITATASDGTPPYQYSINGIDFQTANVFSGLAANVYTVSAKDKDGKVVTTNIVIIKTPTPVLNYSILPASCKKNDGKINLSVSSGAGPFTYSFNGTTYSTTPVLNNVKADSVITAFVKDANGCIDTKSFTVPFHCPAITFISVNETCGKTNGNITVNVSNEFAPYQYSLDGINYKIANLFTGLKGGTYQVFVKDAMGVVNSASTTLRNSCPVSVAVVTDAICSKANGAIQITTTNGTEPYQYSIDGIQFQQSNLFTGLSEAAYTVTVKDTQNSIVVLNVQVKNTPSPDFNFSNSGVSCSNNDGKIIITATGGKPSYLYSLDGNNYVSGNSFSNLTKGLYTTYVKDANGCITTKGTEIILQNNLNLTMRKDTVICEGESVQLTTNSNATQFQWTAANTLNNPNAISPIASPVTNTTYYVTATKGICTKTDSVFIQVYTAPIAIAKKDTILCFGQSVQIRGEGGVNYLWTPSTYLDNTNKQNPVVMNPKTGIQYSLKVIDNNGCRSLNNSSIKIGVKQPTKVFAGNDTVLIKSEPLQLNAIDVNNIGFVNFQWMPPSGLNDYLIKTPIARLNNDQRYIVTAATAEGCIGSDTILIKVVDKSEIYVPTAFTPNKDGLNDVLRPIPIGIKEFKYFKVFNRWGELIFSTTNPAIGWKGTYKGFEQIPGYYTWVCLGIDYKGIAISRGGTVLLIR